MRIAVFSTYDITPGGNGGEIRFQNLYRRLSQTDHVRVVAYDRQGTAAVRRHRLAPALDVANMAISFADKYQFSMNEEQTGLYPHDVMCIEDYDFSTAFLNETQATVKWADVVVVTNPFLNGLVFSLCGPLQLKVFEAHNVEGDAKAQYYAASRAPALSDRLVAATIRSERQAVWAADLVVAVSQDDADRFVTEYGISRSRVHVVPNGVNVEAFDAITPDAKRGFRAAAGLADSDVGVFLGSSYGPNVDSYRLARQWLSDAGFSGTILVVGSIAKVFNTTWPKVGFTEHWMGFVDDAIKRLVLSASDFALQIVASGGGTNLKLFDYMAAGAPILANAFGARGVAEAGWFIPADTAADISRTVCNRAWHSGAAAEGARNAHAIAMRDYDWTLIAARYRALLA